MGEVLGDSLAQRLLSIEERLTIQENTSRLLNASVREGSIHIENADGTPLLTLGKNDDGTYSLQGFDENGNLLVILGQIGTSEHGFQIQDENGRILFKVTAEHGQTAPRVTIPMVVGNGARISGDASTSLRPGTAATAELWRGVFYSVGDQVDYDMTVYANAGSITWSITIAENGVADQLVVSGTDTSNSQKAGTFTIPASALVSGTDPAGRRMVMKVFATYNIAGPNTVDIQVNSPPVNYSS